MKKILIAGLTAVILTGPLLQTEEAFASEPSKMTQQAVSKHITHQFVVKSVVQWMQMDSYIQRGGGYQEGEYKTFQYQGQTYRYLSKDIDTKQELMNYVTKIITVEYAEKYIKDKGLIVHNGKLAQLEADGGSLLQWDKAVARYEKTSESDRIYTVKVPVGDTGETSIYQVNLQWNKKDGWKINKGPYQEVDLDIPFNINPAFLFLHYLPIDSNVSKEQLVDSDSVDVDSFKDGITKLEVRTIEETGRTDKQIEFAVTFDVTLTKNNKGSLKSGLNQLFFLVENTGEMEFKIVRIDTASHLGTK